MSQVLLILYSALCSHLCLATDEHKIEFIELNFDDAWGFNLENWTVNSVIKNSQAHKNGVREGWKVIEIDGCKINEENEEVLNTLIDFQPRMVITFRHPGRQEMFDIEESESFLDESISNEEKKNESLKQKRENQHGDSHDEFIPLSSPRFEEIYEDTLQNDEKFHFLAQKLKSFSSDGKTLTFENCLALIEKVHPNSTADEHVDMVEDLLSQIWIQCGAPTISQMVSMYKRLYKDPDLREKIDCHISLLGFETRTKWNKKLLFKRKRIIGKEDYMPSSCDSTQEPKRKEKPNNFSVHTEHKIKAQIADALQQIPSVRNSVEIELFIYFYLCTSTDLNLAEYCQKVVEWKKINNPASQHREYNYKNIVCNEALFHAENWVNKANQFLKEIKKQTSGMTVVRRMKYTRMLLYKIAWLEIKAQSFGLVFATEVGDHSVNAYESWIGEKDEETLEIELDIVEFLYTTRMSVDHGISSMAEIALKNIGFGKSDTRKIYLPELKDYQNDKKYRLEILRRSAHEMNEVLNEKFKNQ